MLFYTAWHLSLWELRSMSYLGLKTADFGSTLSISLITNCLMDLEKLRSAYGDRMKQGAVKDELWAGTGVGMVTQDGANTSNPCPRTT